MVKLTFLPQPYSLEIHPIYCNKTFLNEIGNVKVMSCLCTLAKDSSLNRDDGVSQVSHNQ